MLPEAERSLLVAEAARRRPGATVQRWPSSVRTETDFLLYRIITPTTGPRTSGSKVTRSPMLKRSMVAWARACCIKRSLSTMRLLRSMSSDSVSLSISMIMRSNALVQLRLSRRAWCGSAMHAGSNVGCNDLLCAAFNFNSKLANAKCVYGAFLANSDKSISCIGSNLFLALTCVRKLTELEARINHVGQVVSGL